MEIGARAETRPGWPPIVGIGASAGGLEAFTRLLRHVPADSGLAYVLVQHLDPTHESLLPELLAREAVVPVVQVRDGMRIEPDHVFVIPPNATMTVTDSHLRLAARHRPAGRHTPIDDFLCSLAETHGSAAIGVILSGAGNDGARGIEAIKAEGGITMAQDAASAAYPSMPQNAIATGHLDFVLPPEALADELARIGRHLAARPPGDTASADGSADLQKILLLLRKRSGVDFREYRGGTVQRRILRRMLVHRRDTPGEYLEHLRADSGEVDALFDELLIGVTRFFRDPEVFAVLQETAFPIMMQDRAADAPLRAWIAGCAGGEETYSIAMTLLEFLGDAATSLPIQIFGTDLSEASIATARSGIYPASIEADVSAERLRRFFVKEDGGYRIAKPVRDLCIFSRQNLIRDPPFSQLDLVSCRNVLIYLEPTLQQRIFPVFHYALKPNGLLLLGNTESPGTGSELFAPLDKKHRIYRRQPTHARAPDLGFALPGSLGAASTRRYRPLGLAPGPDEVQGLADRLVLDRFAPGGVVINEQMEIVQFRGRTTGFLEHAPGAASLNVLKLVRAELLVPLRAAIQAASAEGRVVREDHIAVRAGHAVRHVAVEVIPFRPNAAPGRFFVVLFEDERTPPVSIVAPEPPATAPEPRTRGRGAESRELRALREELAGAKQYLQDVVEAHEAANEELRAASEEIQSSNEELQSTNEELETTKEEIQATNEELTTVNDELRQRNRELAALSGDLTNVLSSAQLPIIIVGGDLRLRRFTPSTDRVMKVIPSDSGRPLSDIKLRVNIPDLEGRILRAIDSLAVTEEEVRDDQGHWWSMTIRPYRTVEQKVDGAVLVFTDIDAAKQYGERAEEVSEARRQLLVVSNAARADADDAREKSQVANRAKSAFLASMSHDLRTPLNAIGGYVQLLEMGLHGPVTEAQRVDFTRIRRNARHLLALITDILNFTKLEAGTIDFHVTDVALSDVVAELEALIGPQLQAKSLTFERGRCDATARADPDRLQQILVNLVTNAIKFTDRGGRIGMHSTSTETAVRLEISDTGMGIAADHLERIFEPFVQLDRSLSSANAEGVGLGLAISRDLARRMGGDLAVESVVGQGSRFTLTLPRGGDVRDASI